MTEVEGFLQYAYDDDSATSFTGGATFTEVFCDDTTINTWTKFTAAQLYSSSDLMAVIAVAKHDAVKNTTNAVAAIAKTVLTTDGKGYDTILDRRNTRFGESTELQNLRKFTRGTATVMDTVFPCPQQLLQLAHADYDNKVINIDDPMLTDTGVNRFKYFADYNWKTYYSTYAYTDDDAAKRLSTDAQTNDNTGSGAWTAIADGAFGIMLGKFVVNVQNAQRAKATDTIYYGELDMFGITANTILQAGWTTTQLKALVAACRAKVTANKSVTLDDAALASVSYADVIAGTGEATLTKAIADTLSPEMVAGLMVQYTDALYNVRPATNWVYEFDARKQSNADTKMTSSDFWAFRLNQALSALSTDRNTYNNVSWAADMMLKSQIGDT